MVKVIETNLSMQVDDTIVDNQSRVIEVDSWKYFVDEIRDGRTVNRNATFGSMYGNSVPSNSRVENLKYDDFHLSCDIYNNANMKTKKLAYLIKE